MGRIHFNNPVPAADISFDFVSEAPVNSDVDITPVAQDTSEEQKPKDDFSIENVEGSESAESTESGENSDKDLTLVEKQENNLEVNPYLNTINSLVGKGLFDGESFYEGFTEETEPSEEVLEKFIEHNFELREKKALQEFVEDLSPLTQRILSFDLNSRGQNVDHYLRALIEENNIKSLSVDNEYDQEKIVRMFYESSDYSKEEITEKLEELKSNSLLEKEAKRVKPKLDLRAEEIAREQEESERELREIENQAKEKFFSRIEKPLRAGKVNNLSFSKETGQKIAQLLMIDNVEVGLPTGKTAKMTYLDAEILKHKFSSKGDPERLIQMAWLLADPESFYKQFANAATTKETNEFVKTAKYNFKGGQPQVEKKQNVKNPGWILKVN